MNPLSFIAGFIFGIRRWPAVFVVALSWPVGVAVMRWRPGAGEFIEAFALSLLSALVGVALREAARGVRRLANHALGSASAR